MFCQRCGREIPDDAQFCEGCGLPVPASPGAKDNGKGGVTDRTDDVTVTETSDVPSGNGDDESDEPAGVPDETITDETVTEGDGTDESQSGTVGDDGNETEQNEGMTLTTERPFWGIWTLAAKDYEECIPYVDSARDRGIDAYVTTTAEWNNLNKEFWYVVTMGTYATEADAETALESVRSAGYGDAYVKYSGEHVGDGQIGSVTLTGW